VVAVERLCHASEQALYVLTLRCASIVLTNCSGCCLLSAAGCRLAGYWNGSLVAVKVLEQVAGDFNPRSSLEPLLHHRLSHPNIVAMFDVCTQVCCNSIAVRHVRCCTSAEQQRSLVRQNCGGLVCARAGEECALGAVTAAPQAEPPQHHVVAMYRCAAATSRLARLQFFAVKEG
jgi:hypothetical protein